MNAARTKSIATLALALLCGLAASCGGESPLRPRLQSKLVVWVQWGGTGLEGKQLEITELRMTRFTDASGIAEFLLPAGTFTLRAYDINHGGPTPPYVDAVVQTARGVTTTVEIVDCVPCVGPSRGA